jgi:hypothetical protein
MSKRRVMRALMWAICCGWVALWSGCTLPTADLSASAPPLGAAAPGDALALDVVAPAEEIARAEAQAKVTEAVAGSVVEAVAPAALVGWSAVVEDVGAGDVRACAVAGAEERCRVVAVGEQVAPGEVVRVGALSQARLRLSDGGIARLDSGAALKLVAEVERSVALLQGRALLDLPEGVTPHARLQTPRGEVVFVGTEVLADVAEAAQWLTVLRGEVEVGALRARAGDEVQWVEGQGPTKAASVDAAGAADWAEPRDEAVGAVPRGVGSLFAQTPGGGTPRPLVAVSRRVEVRIQGPMSYTEITEVFENSAADTLEGVYRFPLPADAQLSKLALKVNGAWQEGVFVENARAERIWQEVIHQWRDPAWLRWKQGEQFELRIFPIEGRSRREVKIGYAQPLRERGGQRVYRYLMPTDAAGVQPVGAFSFEATVEGHDAAAGVVARGYDARITQGPDGRQAQARFEAADFRAAGELSLVVQAQGAGGEGALGAIEAVAYAEAAPSGQGAAKAPAKGDAKGGARAPARSPYTAAVTLRPTWAQADEGLSGGRDFVIILDTSFSRSGAAQAVQAAAVSRLLALMDSADRALVLACAAQCQPVITRAWARPSAALGQEVRDALAALPTRGTTNLLEGPRVAAAALTTRPGKEASRPARIILFTDGQASTGAQDPAQLREALSQVLHTIGPNARLTPVDLGGDSDPLALSALALGGHGKRITFDPAEAVGTAARRVLAAQGDHLLSDITLTFPPGYTDIHPQAHMPLAPGEPLTVFARPPAHAAPGEQIAGEVILRGHVNGAPFEQRLALAITPRPDPGLAWVPKGWAHARIQSLELEDATRHRAEIVDLSLRYGVLSRHTSLMALESDAMRREFGLKRDQSPTWTGDAAAPAATTMTSLPSPAADPPDTLSGFAASDISSGAGGAKPAKSASAEPAQRAPEKGARALADEDFGPLSKDVPQYKPTGKAKRVNPAWVRAFQSADYTKRIAQARADIAKRPNDPKPLKLLIRLLGMAGLNADAAAEVAAWLAKNPRDPEALLLAAEVALRAGDPAEAAHLIADAAEVGARALWLQRRLLHAYEATDQPALACHQRLSVLGLQAPRAKEPAPSPLSCPVASDLTWLPAASASSSPAPALASAPQAPTPAPARPHLRLSLTWEGGADDLDVALVSADGRLIAWHGGHDDVHVTGARSTAAETLTLKRLASGIYAVEVLRAGAAVSTPTRGTLTVELEGQPKKTFPFTTTASRTPLASLRWAEYW